MYMTVVWTKMFILFIWASVTDSMKLLVTTAKLIFGSVDEQAKGGTYGKVTLGKIFGIEHFSWIFTGLVVGAYLQEDLEYCL